MRILWEVGQIVLFDITIFETKGTVIDNADVVVVHKYESSDDEKEDGQPGDLFGA